MSQSPVVKEDLHEVLSLPRIIDEKRVCIPESSCRPLLPPLKDLLTQVDTHNNSHWKIVLGHSIEQHIKSDCTFRFNDFTHSSPTQPTNLSTNNNNKFYKDAAEQKGIQSSSSLFLLSPDAFLCATLESISKTKTPVSHSEVVPSNGEQTYRCFWDLCDSAPFSTRTGLATHVSSHLVHYVDLVTRSNCHGYPCR